MYVLRSRTGAIAGNRIFEDVVVPLLTGTIAGTAVVSRLVAVGMAEM